MPPVSYMRLCHNLSWFRTCDCGRACTLRLHSIHLHSLEISLQCFSEVMLLVLYSLLYRLRCLVRPLVLICHCKPHKRIITCAVVPFNVFGFFCRQLLQNYATCAERLSLCIVFLALSALRRLVDDREL